MDVLVTRNVGAVTVALRLAALLLVLEALQFPGVLGAPNIVGDGYRLTSIKNLSDTSGIVAHLKLIKESQTYGPDINELRLVARYQSGERLQVHITDSHHPRWEVPRSVIPRKGLDNVDIARPKAKRNRKLGLANLSVGMGGSLSTSHPLEFSYTVEPFGFAVVRRSNGEVLFNSTPSVLISSNGSQSPSFGSTVFKDQYLEMSTHLPYKSTLYGLGESTRPDGLRLTHGRKYTLWATDIGSDRVDIDLYGTYPFVMDIRDEGNVHGLLLLNSNGMDVNYDVSSMTFRAIGGVFDFYFFAGPSPLAVVDQYTQLVGRPASMPYWVLGFHQSRFGYEDVHQLETVVAKYKEVDLPLESMWSDIDYMDSYKDFTLEPNKYSEDLLRPFVDSLHANGQKYIMILDPGIKIEEGYSTYERGIELDVFVKNETGGRYIAQVWPGATHFPDFLHPDAQTFWSKEVAEFYKVVPFDGLWLDMNEPSNFCSGPTCYYPPDEECPELINQCCMVCDNHNLSRWDDPPYHINSFGTERPLYEKTMAMSCQHYNEVRAYDTHNIYGLTESLVTYRALLEVRNKRPFVLSRSCFVGSGASVAHWTGDNGATWEDLQYSIVSVLNSGMFGVPMVGADICGFNLVTTEELCLRWTQVGAFYPFSRDHSDKASSPQELYLWESVTETARLVFGWRYRLLPFYYTLMYEAHTRGAPIARPLFFHYPEDPAAWNINDQFLIGESLLVSPVLMPEQTSVRAYIPKGTWYNLFDPSKVVRASNNGYYEVLSAPLDTINVHVREGSILPMQDAAMTTTLARKTPFSLLVAFGPYTKAAHPCDLGSIICEGNGILEYASGQLFLDDDDSQVQMEITPGKATFVKYEAFRSDCKYALRAYVTEGAYALQQNLLLQTVSVLGVISCPPGVLVDGELATSVNVKMNAVSSSLDISDLNLLMGKDFIVTWEITSSTDEAPSS